MYELFIDLSSMADDEDKDGQNIVLDLVDDAIVSDPYPITGPALAFYSHRAWGQRPTLLMRQLFWYNREGKF
jgi:hypothetical protein